MPEVWEGKAYKNYESENFNDYMKALGKLLRFIHLFFFSIQTLEIHPNREEIQIIFIEIMLFFIKFKVLAGSFVVLVTQLHQPLN